MHIVQMVEEVRSLEKESPPLQLLYQMISAQ